MGKYLFNQMGTEDNPYTLHEYGVEDFKEFCEEYFKDSKIIRSKRRCYNNAIVSFDTETTSFKVGAVRRKVIEDGEEKFKLIGGRKFACVYIWQMAFGKEVWIGRYLEELIPVIDTLKEVVEGKLVIWVHNLSYDWTFFRTYFYWDNLLFMDTNKPVYAVTGNIEFRCSYLLTNKSLADITKDDLEDSIYGKMSGDLDYEIPRTPLTPLTDEELKYCLYDVLTQNEYLLKYAKENKHNSPGEFPYTKTGRVRRLVKSKTVDNPDRAIALRYRDKIKKLTITPHEYQMLIEAFAGGFTHANANYVEKILEEIGSSDVASMYPGVMVRKKFPMSKGIRFQYPTQEMEQWILRNKLSIFSVMFEGVRPKINFEHYFSVHKARNLSNVEEDNGRIVKADRMRAVMTNIDFEMFLKCYDIDDYQITDGYYYEADYLPIELVEIILDLYGSKTKLKGEVGKETIYKAHKEDLNCIYGWAGQKPVKDPIIYDQANNMFVQPVDMNDEDYENKLRQFRYESTVKQLEEYNDNEKRTNSYVWAPFVTAYARQQLWNNILALGDDYVYSDTDSNKFKQIEKNLEHFDKVNTSIIEELKKVSKERKIPMDKFAPTDIDDVPRPIGVWEYEGAYYTFKTLGAKRYLTYGYNSKKKKNELVLTCAGLNKKDGVKYLVNNYDKKQIDPFDEFRLGMQVPAEYSGRKIATYSGPGSLHKAIVKGIDGKEVEVCSNSWIHLEPTPVKIEASAQYKRYLSLLNSPKMLQQIVENNPEV